MPKLTFAKQRYWFVFFKERLKGMPALKTEVERAFELLLDEYDTAVYENRFVVGGVCEYILGAVMRAAGIDAVNTGARNPRIDIQLPGCDGFSVKGSFTKARSDIRLINSLGSSDKVSWTEATVFILSGAGLAYGDPQLLRNATKSTQDALTLKRKMLDEMLEEHPELSIPLAIPYKAEGLSDTKVASQAVAKEIMTRPDFVILASNI